MNTNDNLYNLVVTEELLEGNVLDVFPDSSSVNSYIDRQLEIENYVSLEAKRKYLESLKNTKLHHSTAGSKLIKAIDKTYTVTIEEYLRTKPVGRWGSAYKLLVDVPPQVLANLTLKTLMNSVLGSPYFNSTCRAIGKSVKEHKEWIEFQKGYRHLANAIMKKADQQRLSTQARIQMVKRVKKDRITLETWGSNEYLHVGAKLIDLLMESVPDLFSIDEKYENNKTQKRIVPTDKCLHVIRGIEETEYNQTTAHMPMIIPPLPWTDTKSGGYLNTNHDLIKRIFTCHWNDHELYDLSKVYTAVNAVQETGWRINQRVLETMETAWKQGLTIGKLPNQEDVTRPVKPADIASNTEALNEYRRENTRITIHNEGLKNKRISIGRKIRSANRCKTYENIYFPQQLDFRGRMYPMPPDINPQSDDFGVALLEFSEGKPLGDNGGYWLCVHMANLYDESDGKKLSQLSFDDRVDWVMAHKGTILDCAASPLENTWWSKGDKPWQFLAACYEFAGYIYHGDDYVSHLPIQMDGSCNGLQHFTAMLRDKVGGKSVNLLPSDEPNDIYSVVADKCNEIIRNDTGDVASWWKGRVTRSDVKRPVMTLPYGVTKYGMVDQIKENLKDTLDPSIDTGPLAKYLTDVIYQALGETISSAVVGMNWLRGACEQVLENGSNCFWVTPSGFPVKQEYFQMRTTQLECYMAGKKTKITNYKPTPDTFDGSKSKSAIAPNFVHSLDAAHLVLTICKGIENGLTHFSMVHDSYGVHATDVDTLHDCIRSSFVEMYSENTFESFAAHNGIQELPEQGDLDINSIAQAEYFFA